MKHLTYLLLGFFLLFSCSPVDESFDDAHLSAPAPTPAPVPTVAQYHVLNDLGNVTQKFFFNENGRLVEETNNNSSSAFSYDLNNRISNITTLDYDTGSSISNDIIYDAQDRVLSIGERTFDYHEIENNYTENIYYNWDYDLIGDVEYVWNLHERFNFIPANPIPQFCYYMELVQTNLVTGEVIITGDCEFNHSWYTNFENNNVTGYGAWSPTNIEYDNLTNPLFQNQTNLTYLLSFLVQGANGWTYQRYYDFISENKKIHLEYAPEDPESNVYLYNLNSKGLPIDMTRQYFYVGNYEGEYLAAKFYYQGGDIPD